MAGRLNGKVALVTGAASGLGYGTAQRFVEEGARVFVSDINDAAGEAAAAALGAVFLPQDVSLEAHWETVLDAVLAQASRLDVLVNNAGVFTSRLVEETPLAEWQRVLDVNLTGVFLGCKHGVAAMARNPGGSGGSIINLSSVAGLHGQVGGSAYSASKGGVRLLTKAVALENAARGIRCNSIHPGIIETPMLKGAINAAEDPAARRDDLAARLPIRSFGDPARDIGGMAVFLASDDSQYVTGAELVVDGGMTAGLPT